jgi:hypothetical protein
MPNPIHISEEYNRAIRCAVAEQLRLVIWMAGRQRVPRYLRQSLDRLKEEDLGYGVESAASAKAKTNTIIIVFGLVGAPVIALILALVLRMRATLG